jgi:hypothetical protein
MDACMPCVELHGCIMWMHVYLMHASFAWQPIMAGGHCGGVRMGGADTAGEYVKVCMYTAGEAMA